nr:MAG TPA: peroxin [Caudoviricetes sp.]DAT12195.1 MAG TPA: Peroxisomal biogenesis factor [Caudoviricetes sp.]
MKIWYNDGTVKAKGLSESEIPQLLSKALPPRSARSFILRCSSV